MLICDKLFTWKVFYVKRTKNKRGTYLLMVEKEINTTNSILEINIAQNKMKTLSLKQSLLYFKSELVLFS